LVSVMYANNEIGTIQPIKEIARVVEEFRRVQKTAYPYIHTDACQAVNYLDVSMEKLGVDLFVFNGSKIYGPKGIGVLCVRKGVEMVPMVFGGGQEDGLRSGTENVAYIVGLAKALEITENIKEKEVKRLTVLRDHFINKLLESIPQAVLNGDREARLPNNVHITIPDVEDDVLVVELDARGVACSSKSACKASSGEGSHVTLAIDGIEGSHLRFSLGRDTVKKDVEYVTRAISHILKKYKKL
ncbi:MAG: aminotransferase class V-fold PLP-dependent enzyme, partial [Candidatus Pacebacteria bacterium]|nr:aminotransferase class V-fold PLP-dependent enzyme [Candidatus Paceibacterota bacterium]